MTAKNNYGAWLDSEIPSPGVISFNKLNYEYLSGGEEICLDCDEIIEEVYKMKFCPKCDTKLILDECPECNWNKDEEYDLIECFEHTKLIGDWKKDEEGLYVPDEEGEFAAKIDSQNDVIVLWSKFTVRGTPCSPCAAWGISIGVPGEFLCYTLPDYLIYKGE